MDQQLVNMIKMGIAVAWRRRYLLLLPMLVMVPVALFYGMFGPRTYVAKSLMLLQESGGSSPLAGRDAGGQMVRMQERIAGLQALLKSERVLGNVFRDIYGETAARDQVRLAGWMRDFSADLSLDLIGTDFIEFRLKDGNPKGMGKRLEAVTARFLEALLPEQNAMFATQVLLDKRKEELDAAERELARFKQQVSERMPGGLEAPAAKLAEARSQLQAAQDALANLKAEISKARAGLASKPAVTGRIEQEIAQVRAEIAGLEGRGSDAGDELQLVQGRLAQLMHIRELEDRQPVIEKQIRDLGQTVDALQRTVRQSAPLATQLASLEREVVEAREAYDAYAKRYSKSGAGGRASGVLNAPERIKLIDVARDPDFPANSSTRLAMMMLLSGIVLGVGMTLLVEVLDSRVRRPEEVERIAGVPLVASLG